MIEPEEFQRRLGAAFDEIIDHNRSFSDGVKALLVGRTVVDASAEIWDGDGNWSIELTFDDGSKIEVPGATYAEGPLADLVRMAGGKPEYDGS